MMDGERPYTSQDLARYIEEHGIQAELIRPSQATPSVRAAAAALGCAPEQIIKSLVFLIDGRPYLVIASGEARVSYRRLASHFSLSRKRVRMASPAEVLTLTGYPAGGVPPFGLRNPLPTLMDPGVLDQEIVFGGGGDEHTLVQVSTVELRRVTRPTLVALVEDRRAAR